MSGFRLFVHHLVEATLATFAASRLLELSLLDLGRVRMFFFLSSSARVVGDVSPDMSEVPLRHVRCVYCLQR